MKAREQNARSRSRWLRLAAIAVVAGALGASRAVADAPGPIELSVLSYNTRGLPEFVAGDGPAERHRRIGPLLNGYDLVLLQEDFVHHEELLVGAEHPLVVRGNGPQSLVPGYASWLCPWCGSGLTILADLAPERLLEVERVPFGVCAGWIFRRLDCWASKGILRVRLELAPGIEIDVYDLHLDAGMTGEDRYARARQLEIVRDHARRASEGRALVVAGDFNVWSALEDDHLRLEALIAELGLRRAAVPPVTRGYPGVDRIYYRSGRDVRLEVLEASVEEAFVDDEGRPLSDHAAIQARLRITPVERSEHGDVAGPSRDRRRPGTRPAGRRSRRRRRRASPGGSR
jgi:hypothetical protein